MLAPDLRKVCHIGVCREIKKSEKESVKVMTETLDLIKTGIQERGSCFGDPTK